MAENVFLSQRPTPLLGLNINDVIDVIKEQADSDMSSVFGGGAPSEANYSVLSSAVSHSEVETDPKKNAYVQITEQPQPKALRFRYICEGRSAGSIPGVSSTSENKTYPSIKVCNYKGHAFVVVSCVTVDPPYRPHPHNLVGKSCKHGICTMKITNDSMECMFSNLGIQCVKKKEVEQALALREEQRVDPYRTGFAHRNQSQSIDLNSVRLCFQVFLEGREKGKFTYPLPPVVSDPIYDKKATSELVICKLSDCTSTVLGGKEIILLCDKVTKEDIQIRFFEVKDGVIHWEALGDFQAGDVHKQVAISFKTPKYKDTEIENSVKVYIQLLRPSDKSTSEPRPFEYLPMNSGTPFRSLKRLKNNYGLFHRILGLENATPPLQGGEESLPHKKTESSLAPALSSAQDLLPKGRPHSPPLVSISPPPTLERKVEPSDKALAHPQRSSPKQSLDDIKERLTANLDKKRPAGGVSNPTAKMLLSPTLKHSPPLWTDEASIYSGADILEEVLSQGSVNDILSAVGEELTVYEDVGALSHNEAPCDPDVLYGDASYASCYSNLEFVLGRAKAAQDASSSTLVGGSSSSSDSLAPILPPKSSSKDAENNNDFAIYGTPSGKPIHPNKEALLRERGFLAGTHDRSKRQEEAEAALYYSPVSDILEMEEESEMHSKEINVQDLPKSILDLFV